MGHGGETATTFFRPVKNNTGGTMELYHGLRREELCTLKVRDIHPRRGVLHLRVHGKGGKVRYLPLHPGTKELVTDYLEAARHGGDDV